MATEGVNITEDAEMAECEGDKVVTMMDVLQEQQEFEEDANAVLGASDDKNCTYAKGYIKRQAIYACLTCCPDVKTDPTKRAGVCLACSLMCHENHELVELYTKRNFRCDCGNPKFNSHPCQFTPNKPDLNDDNIYNQNFSGLYCICQRPYPDPEAITEDEMIQCIICEDWLHAAHLDAVVPANDQYSEMICKGCMEKNDFLHDYSNLAINAESVDVDILNVNKSAATPCNGDVTTEVLENNRGNKSQTADMVLNGIDDDLSDNKENEPRVKRGRHNESLPNNDESKPAVQPDNTDNIQEKTDNDLDSVSRKSQECQIEEAKAVNDDANKSDELTANEEKREEGITELTKEDTTLMSEETQNTINDDKMESSEVETNISSSEPVSEPQEQKEEQSTTDVKADGEQENTDVSEIENNVDANKTEGQQLDDTDPMTSDNTSDTPSKPTGENVTMLSSENATDEEKPTIELENKDSSINTESNIDNSCNIKENPVPDTNDLEVPDTSQPKDGETKTIDDKTDSVMDAIDELLKDPTETKGDSKDIENQSSEELADSNENKDNSESPKANEIEMSELEDKPDNNVTNTTDSKEQIESDVEMKENKSQDEPPSTESTTLVDAVNTNTDPSLDNQSTDNALPSETDENTSVINEQKVNDDSLNKNEALNKTDDKGLDENINSKNEPPINENKESEALEAKNDQKRKLSTELAEETSPKKIKLDKKCVRPKNGNKVYNGATFWPSNFRQKLCTCGECISMYKDLHVLFLTDLEDTVAFYENLGKENLDGGASQYEKGLQALSSLDRIQQINALTEYNKMRDKLLDFLKSFKDRKEIVKEEDIKAFFAGMKPRREPDGVYFCR